MEEPKKGKEKEASTSSDPARQSPTGEIGRQSGSETPEYPTQEDQGNPAKAQNDQPVGSPVLRNSSNSTNGTRSTATHTGDVASSSSTSQQHTRTSTSTSVAGTRITITRASSYTGQERNRISASPSNAGTSQGAGTSTGRNHLPQACDLMGTISHGAEIIRSMAVGIDGVLFTGSDNEVVREWCRGPKKRNFKSSSGPVNAIDVLYSGEFICVFLAHEKGVIRVWRRNVARGTEFRLVGTLQTLFHCFKNMVLPGRARNAISCLCLSEDSNFVYCGSADHTVSTWCIKNYVYKLVDTIRSHRGAINALTVGPGVVFSGSSDGVINMWKRELYGKNQDKVRHLLIGMFTIQNDTVPTVINALVFRTVNFNSGWLYAGSSDGKVRCWKNLRIDRETEKPEPEVMSFHKGGVTCLALCSGRIVFSGSMDGTICAWKRKKEGADEGLTHKFSVVVPGHSRPVTCIAAHDEWRPNIIGPPDRWILYSAALDGTLKVWRVYDRLMTRTAASGSDVQSGHQDVVELRRRSL